MRSRKKRLQRGRGSSYQTPGRSRPNTPRSGTTLRGVHRGRNQSHIQRNSGKMNLIWSTNTAWECPGNTITSDCIDITLQLNRVYGKGNNDSVEGDFICNCGYSAPDPAGDDTGGTHYAHCEVPLSCDHCCSNRTNYGDRDAM